MIIAAVEFLFFLIPYRLRLGKRKKKVYIPPPPVPSRHDVTSKGEIVREKFISRSRKKKKNKKALADVKRPVEDDSDVVECDGMGGGKGRKSRRGIGRETSPRDNGVFGNAFLCSIDARRERARERGTTDKYRRIIF